MVFETSIRGKESNWMEMGVQSKDDGDGLISRYKARLVAKRYAQTFGIDFEETFRPILARFQNGNSEINHFLGCIKALKVS